jgi:hypothetical protein
MNVDKMPSPGVVLFGAGTACVYFMRNTGIMPEIIVDNDSRKRGTRMGGICIVSPDSVSWERVKRVVIVSEGLADILEQLNSLGVRRELIEVPPKALCGGDGLSDFAVRQKMLDLLGTLSALPLTQPVVCIYGTALGIIRDGDLIHWDNDVDLVVGAESHSKVDAFLRQSYDSQQTSATKHVYTPTVDRASGVPLSVETYDQGTATFTQTLFGKEWTWSVRRFLEPARRQVHSRTIYVPAEPESYLEAIYGPSWSIPNRNFSNCDYVTS